MLLTSYDAREYPISCSYFQTPRTPARIQTFSTPSGSITLSYDLAMAGDKGGTTTVTYPEGATTTYRFNKFLLLEAIENRLNGILINQKSYRYDAKQHIRAIETADRTGHILITKQFECDASGNPTLETTISDIGATSIRRTL